MTSDAKEWLVTNGLGGYASGTVAGPLRRRYHGVLIAALPAPLGRTVLLTQLVERVCGRGGEWIDLDESRIAAFELVRGLPVWHYDLGAGGTIEKRILMPYQQNTVHITYRSVTDGPHDVELRPIIGFRPHEHPVSQSQTSGYALTIREHRLEVASEGAIDATLRFLLHAPFGEFVAEDCAIENVQYFTEEHRGYEATGNLWSPGRFRTAVSMNHDVTLIASSESWDQLIGTEPDDCWREELARRKALVETAALQACDEACEELVVAADQFVILPSTRAATEARGPNARTIIAGYHWFTDWGRDTMISLEGLTLVTGRHAEAAEILRTFAGAERDGLIPNYFPEGDNEGVYHTADATLWFFHAISRYLAHTGDRSLVDELLPVLRRIVDAHVRGTRFGIHVDASDGLLSQGAEGYQLTWMDAKVDGWVVTPRRGKPVEINALWHNALRLMHGWTGEQQFAERADRARASFNARFWSDALGHLYDVVDMPGGGDDPACRPNQVFAISLEHPVLDRAHWEAVLSVVEGRLLTPVGLRSLAPGHPDYKPRYFGDLRTRDAAYHQGTVWGWLIGPAVDARLKTWPNETDRARGMLDGLLAHLDDAGVGSLSEIFDADPPYTPRGCIAQAWSVAEVLRCLWKISAARSSIPARR